MTPEEDWPQYRYAYTKLGAWGHAKKVAGTEDATPTHWVWKRLGVAGKRREDTPGLKTLILMPGSGSKWQD